MTDDQLEALHELVREIVNKELRSIFADIVNEYEFEYEEQEKIDALKQRLKAGA